MSSEPKFTPEDIRRRIDSVMRRSDQANKKKAALQGTLKAKQEELAALLKEIREAGYQPKELVLERDKAQADLISKLETYETRLTEVEAALAALES